MTRDGAVDTGSPNTPADDQATSKSAKAKSFSGLPRHGSGSLKEEGGTEKEQTGPALCVAMVGDSPQNVDSPGISGTEKEVIRTSPVAETIKESPKTGSPMIYSKFDSHGEPVKEQERVSYQNMIVRYGDWSNIRRQVFAYFVLIFIAVIYERYSMSIKTMTSDARVKDGHHIHCGCHTTVEQLELSRIRDKFHMEHATKILVFAVLFLTAGLAPLWERFIGRRKLLFGILGAAVPASVIFTSENVSTLKQTSHFVLTLCGLITMMITFSNLVEMLPYESRFLAIYSFTFASSIVTSVATIHFRFRFSAFALGLCLAIANVIGMIVVKLFIKESICHLNIINEIETIEKIVQKEEYRLHVEKREGSRKFHEAIAKKIFEDLVYLDQDELKLSNFFKRLYKNFAMIDIVLAFFQSISTGIFEYDFTRSTNERFFSPSWLTMDMMLGTAVSGILLYFLRKAHRNRVICLLFAIALLTSIVRNALCAIQIDYDKSNSCAAVQYVHDNFVWLSIVLSTFSTAIGYCLATTILLHFLETTPSILRPSCVLFIYLPKTLAYKHVHRIFLDHVSKDLTVLLPVYIYHLLIIILTMLRNRSRLPFSLYLFDIMPSSESQGDDNSKDFQCATVMEHDAQNFSMEEMKVEEKQSPIEEKKEEVKQKKPKRNLKRMFKSTYV